ncbi:MAG: hypothetical protein PHT07_19410 [Paludibacter sp.]|nr:hypothetical protein [Paludibacter sp.]
MKLIVPDKFVYPARRLLLSNYIPIAIGNKENKSRGLQILKTNRNFNTLNEHIRAYRVRKRGGE